MHVAAGEEWQRNCAWPANFANKGRGGGGSGTHSKDDEMVSQGVWKQG